MTETRYKTPSAAFHGAVRHLVAPDDTMPRGVRLVSPRGQATRERKSQTTLIIEDPTAWPLAAGRREFRHVIAACEGLSLVGQTSVPEVVVEKVGAFRKFMRESLFWGAYGPRVAGDVANLVDLLKGDPDSRQAVLTIFDSGRDLGRTDQLDLPCTVSIQFLWRERLEMRVQMRSNDVWLGLPYDLGQFAMLQAAVAQALGTRPGEYTHTAQSLHLYDRDLRKAADVRHAEPERMLPWPWWGGDGSIGSTAERARRLLLGRGVEGIYPLTEFEAWCAELLA